MACRTGQAAVTHACEPFEHRIRRFPRGYRRRVRRFVNGSKRLKDLLYSFPGAVFVLAAGNRGPDARAQAMKLVKEGRPLAEIAAALKLPMWVRRVPPEALGLAFGALPDEPDFNRRILNLIPPADEIGSCWLAAISQAFAACDASMALWVAEQRARSDQKLDGLPLLPLAAFAWFSQRKGEAAAGLIEKPWGKTMSFAKAAEETRLWLERIIIDYCADDVSGDGGWLKPRKASGLRFLPLRTAEELAKEGERMGNCVGSYARQVETGKCLIYSIRRGGRSVATLEVVADIACPGRGRVAQLEGPNNTPPPDAVRRAAASWLAKQGRFPLTGHLSLAQVPLRRSRWDAVWQPYLEAKPQLAPRFRPTPEALTRLGSELRALGGRS